MSSPFLKSMVPPFLWNIGKDVKRRLLRSVDHYAYAPRGWATPLPAKSQDYWHALIARQRSECETLIARIQRGEPALTADRQDVKHVIFGYVLAMTAHEKPRVTVLDYGGNLGDYYWLARALVPDVALEYHCKELPNMAAAGQAVSPAVFWHTDDSCLARRYDLAMFSGVMQYLPEWQDILRRAAAATDNYLFVTDVATVRTVPGFLATERSGGATGLYQLLNRDEIIGTIQRTGLRLIREFEMDPHPMIAHAPEQPTRAGWLFQRA